MIAILQRVSEARVVVDAARLRPADNPRMVGDARKAIKASHLYRMQGKDTVEVPELVPGDIGALSKVEQVL